MILLAPHGCCLSQIQLLANSWQWCCSWLIGSALVHSLPHKYLIVRAGITGKSIIEPEVLSGAYTYIVSTIFRYATVLSIFICCKIALLKQFRNYSRIFHISTKLYGLFVQSKNQNQFPLFGSFQSRISQLTQEYFLEDLQCFECNHKTSALFSAGLK